MGWILGGDSVLGLLFAIFFVPELAGRSLEEVDELFDAKLWAWQFKDYKTSGVGHRITMLEDHTATEGGPNEKVAISEVCPSASCLSSGGNYADEQCSG